MHPVITDETAAAAARHLSAADPVLAPVIAQAGLCPVRPHTDYYRELVDAVIGQQLSVKAAAAILGRLMERFDGAFPSPQQILDTSVDDLRATGFSRAKALYVQDLARHIIDGRIDFGRFDRLSNEEISRELTAVKGIGQWTVDMFLLFCMARCDVLPVGDLGIRASMRRLYGLDGLPDRAAIEAIAERNGWRPHLSIASWYIWQNLGNQPATAQPADVA